MANFPTSLDSFTDPTSAEYLGTAAGIGVAAILTLHDDAIEAVEAKIGTGASTSTNNTVLAGNGTGTSAWASSVTNLTLVTPTIATITNGGTLTLPSGTLTLATLTGTETLSGKTLTAPKFATGGFIADANGNELLIFTTTASAVNELTLANGATGVSPSIIPSGETNVGLDIRMKGTAYLRIPRPIGIQVVNATDNTATGDAKAFFRIPEEYNGMNLIAVAATVYTAGTTNTTDIQIRNKTQTADMLSTKITIDSTETDSSTAATAAVIDTANDDVATGDVIAIDVDAISTTPAQGLFVQLRFALP